MLRDITHLITLKLNSGILLICYGKDFHPPTIAGIGYAQACAVLSDPTFKTYLVPHPSHFYPPKGKAGGFQWFTSQFFQKEHWSKY
jgi:hypothetical protein